jgi:hypothetical protein
MQFRSLFSKRKKNKKGKEKWLHKVCQVYDKKILIS